MTDETPQETGDWTAWRSRLAAARRRREDLVSLWQENVDARRGKTTETGRAQTGITVNQDWPLTKAKIAQLYSQTPDVRLHPRTPASAPAVPVFATVLNDTIEQESVGSAIEEVLADVVNASGIGAVIVSMDQRTEPREVPALDPLTLPPDIQETIRAGTFAMPMQTVEHVTDIRFPVRRISPADLLIPSDFTGSHYDHARWLAYDGRMTWPQAVLALRLGEDVKDQVLGADRRASGVSSSLNTDTTKFRDTEVVNFTEVFYWRHYYHQDETSFSALQRVVFVEGLDAPVLNEPYQAQRKASDGAMLGVVRFPIRVLTLTYISDDGLPPSDSSVGRMQVDELESSRDAMVQQRKYSVPMRWGDTNRISPNVKSLLEQGIHQGFIWTNGPGDRAVGEVAKANFPQEKFEFDRIIKSDLTEIWQVGTNQAGGFASGERSASEARIVQQNFQTRVGHERAKVTAFFLSIAEVLAGHLALFGQFDVPQTKDAERMATWDRTALANDVVYSIRADATVRLDAEQRIEQLTRALNLTAQSGFVNPKPLIAEILELSGIDPATVVIDPTPKLPDPVRISIGSADDMMNPLMLAAAMRTQQAGTDEDVAHATAMIQSLLTRLASPLPLQNGPQGQPSDPTALPSAIARPGIAHADWETSPRIERRAEDGGA